ncbi:S1C family serine protease [Balneolaceae bacterium ANBcel3]|nr:S1C family serine protease [Balneolaceae bacterium ANBcel3]
MEKNNNRLYGIIATVFLVFFPMACMDHNPKQDVAIQVHQRGIVHVSPGNTRGYEVGVHTAGPSDLSDAYRQSKKAVVFITFPSDEPDDFFIRNPYSKAVFTGYFISEDGFIVTWIPDTGSLPETTEVTMYDGRKAEAHVVGADPHSGITLLKLEMEKEVPYLIFCEGDSVQTGATVFSISASPAHYHYFASPILSPGIISSTGQLLEIEQSPGYVYPDVLMLSTKTGTEASGGPLLYMDGRLAGMNIVFPDSLLPETYRNHGFAIPGKKIASMVNYLVQENPGRLNYSMGLEMVPVTRSIAERYYLPVKHGLFIVGVNRDGPAYQAGIRPGDIVTRLGGEVIYGEKHARAVLHEYNRGEHMNITFLRGGSMRETEVVLRKRLLEE